MRIVRCSGRLIVGGFCLGGLYVQGGVCPVGGVAGGCLPSGRVYTSPLWTDRHLWKHYLSATTTEEIPTESSDGMGGQLWFRRQIVDLVVFIVI